MHLPHHFYILKGIEPISVDDYEFWRKWMEQADLTIESTAIDENLRVSTLFLGHDPDPGSLGKNPLLFETRAYDPDDLRNRQYRLVRRYNTWREAKEGHGEIVVRLKEELPIGA